MKDVLFLVFLKCLPYHFIAVFFMFKLNKLGVFSKKLSIKGILYDILAYINNGYSSGLFLRSNCVYKKK